MSFFDEEGKKMIVMPTEVTPVLNNPSKLKDVEFHLKILQKRLPPFTWTPVSQVKSLPRDLQTMCPDL